MVSLFLKYISSIQKGLLGKVFSASEQIPTFKGMFFGN